MFSFKKEEVVPAAASPRALQSALSSGIAKQKEHSNVGSPAFQSTSGGNLNVVSTPQPPADSTLGDSYLVSHVSIIPIPLTIYLLPIILVLKNDTTRTIGPSPLPSSPPLTLTFYYSTITSLPFSTFQVIKSVIAKYLQTFPKSGVVGGDGDHQHTLSADADRYYLMVADEEGQVDDDFPEIDPSVPISSVGVDKFVLCDRHSDTPVLRLCIPEAALDIQRIVKEVGPDSELSVSVSQPLLGGRGASSVPSNISNLLSSVPEEGQGGEINKRVGGRYGSTTTTSGANDDVFLRVTLKASNSKPISGHSRDTFVL